MNKVPEANWKMMCFSQISEICDYDGDDFDLYHESFCCQLLVIRNMEHDGTFTA